jgi:hypothetical protein
MEERKKRKKHNRPFKTLIRQQPKLYCGPGETCRAASRNACAAIVARNQNAEMAGCHVDTQNHPVTSVPPVHLGM